MRIENAQMKFFSVDNLKRKILPFLFTAVFTAAINKLYLETYINLYSLLSAVMTFGMYALFDFMSAHKKLSIPIYILLTGAVMTVLYGLMSSLKSYSEFFQLFEWFMTGGETVKTTVVYMLLIVIGFTFFIGSVTYYFSHVIYRLAMFTVISLLPCAIYVKAAQVVPTALAVVIAGLNIFLYIYNYRTNHLKKHISQGKAAAMTAYVDFAAAALLLAVIIPKPSTAPYYEKFEEATSRFSFWGRSGLISGEFMDHSGNADDYLAMDNRLIYIVSMDAPQYFKAQVFDQYEPENRYWTYSETLEKGYKNWTEDAGLMSVSELYKAYLNSDHSVLDKLKVSIEPEDDTLHSAVIQSVDYPSRIMIAPSRTANAILPDRPKINIRRTNGYEIYPEDYQLPGSSRYNVSYFDQNYTILSGWLESGLCDMTLDEYGAVLDDLLGAYFGTDDYDLICAFKADYENALEFSPSLYAPASAEIQRLADKITSGLTYDYEKAEAIERYFHENGFRYDLAYRAPEEEDTPEYFLTRSKKGTCSDFATAYCLLARAAGLTVRYAEGYVPVAAFSENMYYIYTENAHAYPEVFIPGAGWTIYEPTVSGDSLAGAAGNGNTETDYLSVFVTCVAVFISIAAVAVLIAFMPQLEKGLFALKLKIIPAEKGIVLVYGRFAASVEKICGVKTKTLTSRQLSELVESRSGMSSDKIILPFEQVCYGELSTDRDTVLSAYRSSREIIKALKKLRKKK